MKKAVLYTRVSTEEQKEGGFSLQDQYKRLVKYCTRENIEIVGHYEDDHSAKSFNRPKWKQLISDIKDGNLSPNLLLVVRPDRLQRNFESLLKEIPFLQKHGVRIKSLEMDIEVNTPEDKLVWTILNMLPQVDNERRSLNTKRGMRQAKREGRWNGAPPTGYDRYKTGNIHTIKPNAKAKFVEESFKLFAKGIYSKEEVRRMMSIKGFKLTKNPFSRMLSNPVYIGKIVIKAWKEEKEEIVQGLHEAIVTDSLFNKVQSILRSKRVQPLQKTTKDPNLPLRGYLVCAKCGGNLTGAKSKGNGGYYYYYKCQKSCKESFNAKNANEAFESYLNSFQLPDEIVKLYLAIVKDLFKNEDKNILKETYQLEKLITKAQDRIDSIDEKFIDNDISATKYEELSSKYQDEKSELVMKQTRLRSRKTNFQKYLSFSIPLIQNIGNHFKEASIDIKHKIIGSIFPEKLIFEDQKYRTAKPSILLSLFTLNINDLGALKKDVKEIISITSSKALLQGLEPWTL